MPAPTFKKISLDQFADILERFPFTRKIDSVHMHHTSRPNHQQFKGHETIVAMWTYHTETCHWSDIAQHITIDPQGFIWLGRNWNSPPASASGYNGSAACGPFMFETIGDFDIGADPFAGAQRDTVLAVIALVQQRFGLAPQSLRFHHMMSAKSCPGSSISYAKTVDAVRQLHMPAARASGDMAPPFAADTYETRQIVEDVLATMASSGAAASDPPDAEVCTRGHGFAVDASRATAGSRAAPLNPSQLEALRPHLLNLAMGDFSSEGRWTSSRKDVDAIFGEHLPQALRQARENGRPLRFVFQAHGGLVDEAAGLEIAHKSCAWWKANDIYPIYFVWETGAFETIGQLLRRAHAGGARDIFDYTSDPLIQEAARLLQGPKIWGGMKLSAQLASAADIVGYSSAAQSGTEGGASYLARQLAAFCKTGGNDVQLHAVGHSAGSIFHSWFIPCALAMGVPPFRSLQLMAPAVRVDLFKEKLAQLVGPGRGIDALTLYTMSDNIETDDNCAEVYRKSLLYLIFHALEPQRKTPILGLEECLRSDTELSTLFGLHGGSTDAQVVWSRTAALQGRSASTSTSHGGFDDDAPTMGSIARRILSKGDADLIVEYVGDVARTSDWGAARDAAELAFKPVQKPGAHIAIKPPVKKILVGPSTKRRRALCVGINSYPTAPLTGCVADVAAWTRTLNKVGFDVTTLLDQQATRAGIVGSLERMIQASKKGDVLVFQYSGHGTHVPDLNGDEQPGDSPGEDEAICPHDFASGALLLDDDIGRIFAKVPDGVNLTCFIDCCHSGTISRFAAGPGTSAVRREGEHPRFVVAGPDLIAAHSRYRAAMPASETASRGAAPLREVVFSACLSTEVAWESAGQGEFTVRATKVLDAGIEQLSNEQFAERVTQAFGAAPRQHPGLYTGATGAAQMLLMPLGGPASAPPRDTPATLAVPAAGGTDIGVLLAGMQDLLRQLQLLQQQVQQGQQPQLEQRPMMHSEPQTMQHGGPQNR